MSEQERYVSADGVRRAAERIGGHIIQTPVLENDLLNERTGGRIFLKAEVLQHCGSFKLRGAFNRISSLPPEVRARGVVAWSSGNHAQGVARAAKAFKIPATIVMPADAPAVKVMAVRRYGAEIITYDRYTEDREAIARSIAAEGKKALVPSYDHVDVIEGQGTLALETLQSCKQIGVALDAFIVCCGGGGLTAGCATILEDLSPNTEIWIAEPEHYDETWASIRNGQRQYADISRRTIFDALASPTPGEITLSVMRRLVRGGVTITESEATEAIAFAFDHLKLILEPGGAVALAAVLSGKFDAVGKNVGITLSGGNIDHALFIRLISEREKNKYK